MTSTGGFGGAFGFSLMSTRLPPAASTAARAPLLAPMPFTVTLRVSLPDTISFAPDASFGTTPASFSAARSIVSAFIFSTSDSRTSAVASRSGEAKPRFGRRRWSGICPPSKPTLWKPPERAF